MQNSTSQSVTNSTMHNSSNIGQTVNGSSNLSNIMNSMNTSNSIQNSGMDNHNHFSGPPSHHSNMTQQNDRINHSSPNKNPSQGGSIQNGQRPPMNQTSHGKNFPYSMHRKTNSNKLPHIVSSNSKDSQNQSINQNATGTQNNNREWWWITQVTPPSIFF